MAIYILITCACREVLREQVALGDEIVAAMNNVHQTNQVDEEDLEAEMEAMQQEQLDEQMLKTGSVPVSDQIQRLPAAADGPSKLGSLLIERRSYSNFWILTDGAQFIRGRRRPPRTRTRPSSRSCRQRWRCRMESYRNDRWVFACFFMGGSLFAERCQGWGRDRALSVVCRRHLELLIYTLPSLHVFKFPGVSALASLRTCITDDVRRERERGRE